MPKNRVKQLNTESPLFFEIKLGRILKQLITAVNELRTDHATNKLLTTDNKRLANEIRANLVGDYLDSAPGLDVGSTKPNVKNVKFDFHINGDEHDQPALAAGTALSGVDVPQSKYGAWALDVGADEAIDITPAADNATGYDTANDALAGIPAVATDHIRMGTVSAIKVDVDFLNSAPTLAIGSTKTNIAHAEFTHWHAQAEKTELALPVGMILAGANIPQSLYGAFRLEIGVNEVLDLVPADDNATGYANAGLALAGLPSIQANHVNVGTLTVIKVDDHFLNSAPILAIGGTTTAVSHVEFTHTHDQSEKTEGILAAGIALTGATIPQNLYGAFRLEIASDETLDLIAATNNATGHATAELALDDLPAIQADHVNVGTITVFHTDGGGFQPGVTNLNDVGVVAAYADGDLDGFFIPGTTEIDDGEVASIYIDGDLDGFFIPGTTELDDGEVTDVYTDSPIGLNAIGAAITVSSPSAIEAGAVDDIEGEVND